jgi:hypothetical protein
MRPTLLEFRSTKEKTPPYYVYKNSYDGRIIDFKSPKGDCKRSSFSLERRFIAYDILAKKTGYRVGPGAYSPENYKSRIISGSPYRENHCKRQTDNNGYFMVGNCLEFEPGLLPSSKKKLQKDQELNMDSTYLVNRVSRSATTNLSLSMNHSLKVSSESPAKKFYPYTPRAKKQKPKKTKKANKSTKISSLLNKRFN